MKRYTIIFFILLAACNATRTKELATGIATGCNTILQHNAKASALPKNKDFTLLHRKKYSQQFADSLQRVATRLQLNANWLLQVMQAESGLQANAQNRHGATGLIQFLPTTAIALGTTTAQLATMSRTEQLPYVEKFFQPIAGKIRSVEELRLFTFFPAALTQPNDYVLETATLPAKLVASRNTIFDTNGDMKITKGEFLKAIK